MSIDVLIDNKMNHGASNVLFIAGPARWNLVVLFLRNVTLLVLTALSCSHLTWEYTGRDGINTDLEIILSNDVRKHAA